MRTDWANTVREDALRVGLEVGILAADFFVRGFAFCALRAFARVLVADDLGCDVPARLRDVVLHLRSRVLIRLSVPGRLI